MLEQLPVDAHLSRIEALVQERGAVVLVAEPGAGKTTRLPWALAADTDRVICVQPRRVAATHAARRVSEERNEKLGGRVGYAVRFDSKQSAATKVLYVTTGVFMRMLASGNGLGARDTVVLDEFHERSVDIDLALCACVAARRAGDGPSLVVMSATLDAERLAGFLDAPIVNVPGRLFPVSIEYLAPRAGEYMADHVARAARNLLVRSQKRDDCLRALVFVPGGREMRACLRAVAPLKRHFVFDTAELFGNQPFAVQKEVLRARGVHEPSQLIFATRVAETSLTVPDLNAVIDTGLSRRARADANMGFHTLETRPSPRSSLEQRAGRAGRVGPGICVRLFDQGTMRTRPRYDKPELETADCSGPALLLASLGIHEPPFLDAPPAPRWTRARAGLVELGALDHAGQITQKGREMARMPVHPRTAAMLLEARSRQVSHRAARMAALLEERTLRRDEMDFWSSLRWLVDNEGAREGQPIGVDRTTLRSIVRSATRLTKLLTAQSEPVRAFEDEQCDLEVCLLVAFSDRFGRVDGDRLVVVDGATFGLPAQPDRVCDGSFAVVLATKGVSGRPQAVSLAPISENSALEVFLDQLEEQTRWEYDEKSDRVHTHVSVRLGAVEVEATSQLAEAGAQTAAALWEALRRRGWECVLDVDALHTLKRRLELLSQDRETVNADLEAALRDCCSASVSLADVRNADPLSVFRYSLSSELQNALEEQTPLSIDLPGRRGVDVHYELERPPWVGAYLQEFFGLSRTPRAGTEPLTLHLWAPNGRAVQVTSDLGGFWERHYSSLRKELSRRYPKHHWPEDPLSAKPVRLKRYL